MCLSLCVGCQKLSSEAFVRSGSDTESLLQTDGSHVPVSTWVIRMCKLENTVYSDDSIFTVQHLDYCRLVIPDCNDTSFHSLTAVKKAAASSFPGFVDVIGREKHSLGLKPQRVADV